MDWDEFFSAPHFPRIGVTQPEVGLLDLVAVLDLLAKDPINALAIASKRWRRVEAGGSTR
jgi:hypothetical protein